MSIPRYYTWDEIKAALVDKTIRRVTCDDHATFALWLSDGSCVTMTGDSDVSVIEPPPPVDPPPRYKLGDRVLASRRTLGGVCWVSSTIIEVVPRVDHDGVWYQFNVRSEDGGRGACTEACLRDMEE